MPTEEARTPIQLIDTPDRLDCDKDQSGSFLIKARWKMTAAMLRESLAAVRCSGSTASRTVSEETQTFAFDEFDAVDPVGFELDIT